MKVWGRRSSTCDMVASSALWTLWFVANVVVVVDGRAIASRGVRISQWSSGEFLGMKGGIRGYPTCNNVVSPRKSDMGL